MSNHRFSKHVEDDAKDTAFNHGFIPGILVFVLIGVFGWFAASAHHAHDTARYKATQATIVTAPHIRGADGDTIVEVANVHYTYGGANYTDEAVVKNTAILGDHQQVWVDTAHHNLLWKNAVPDSSPISLLVWGTIGNALLGLCLGIIVLLAYYVMTWKRYARRIEVAKSVPSNITRIAA